MLRVNLGDTIKFTEFAFTNPSGGTGMSNWSWDEKFTGIAEAKVIKLWCDYETGWNFICEAVSQNLKEYIERNASILDHHVFVSEFDLTS